MTENNLTFNSSENPSRRYKMVIEYDGTDFAGWQVQGGKIRTVQGVLEKAFGQILSQKVTVIGAGRTDAGVHALGQVAHARLVLKNITPGKLQLAVNSLLPHDVQVTAFEETHPRFHARFWARSRSYRYRIERSYHPLTRRYVWTPRYDWDDAIIARLVDHLPGRHSFRSFSLQRPDETGYISEVISAGWVADAMGATFTITADKFYHKMVRGLVGCLMEVGRGRLTEEVFLNLLNDPRQNGEVFVAPAQGLTLIRVDYERIE
jgi:tRNA pseudouridine38-40 synthase